MKLWDKKNILNEKGEIVEASLPFIISASRATDIPAFYSKWFFNRLDKGYIVWISPFNRKKHYISFEKTKVIVFWSKNPKPIIPYLKKLDDLNIKYYFQFTLNDYETENIEPNVPILEKRIETFKKLSTLIGEEKVIWRFDPLILSENITIDNLIDKINRIGNEIHQYTEKLVFSFADIKAYKKVEKNLANSKHLYREFKENEILEFSRKLIKLNTNWGLELATCSENYDLNKFNIKQNKCIDDELIYRIGNEDEEINNWLGVENTLFGKNYSANSKLKDKGQRKACGCIISKDIGMYNTCNHLCTYCYANHSKKLVINNIKKHNFAKPSII